MLPKSCLVYGGLNRLPWQLLHGLLNHMGYFGTVVDSIWKQYQHSTDNTPTTEPAPLLGTIENPASSCGDIAGDRPSGEYWIQPGNASCPIQVYCDTCSMRNCTCNTAGGWTRVANIDMTDPSQTCPSGFNLITRTSPPLRTCGRPGFAHCTSTFFPVHGIEYSHVCGRVIGYQVGFTDAFHSYNVRGQGIDSYYLCGISITHGFPRQHIWSFAAAVGDGYTTESEICPCTRSGTSGDAASPSFVGQDYFCDSGLTGSSYINSFLYADDPLWDGQGCDGTSTCCEFNNPPWFCKQLPQPTTDNIELRICEHVTAPSVDTPFEMVKLYIK